MNGVSFESSVFFLVFADYAKQFLEDRTTTASDRTPIAVFSHGAVRGSGMWGLLPALLPHRPRSQNSPLQPHILHNLSGDNGAALQRPAHHSLSPLSTGDLCGPRAQLAGGSFCQ